MLNSKTHEFDEWMLEQTKIQIWDRLKNIEHSDHFGDAKYLADGLSELRWRNGRRIYFARIGKNEILLISGGDKNGQNKDIARAKRLLKKKQA